MKNNRFTHRNEIEWLTNLYGSEVGYRIFAVGHFAVGQFTVRKKKPNLTNLIWPNLTKTNIFSYGELSYGKKSAHGIYYSTINSWTCYFCGEGNHKIHDYKL